MHYILIIIAAYLIGSIPFSFLVPKLLGGIDIRHHGSGNTGATNVLRTLGLKIGFIAFLGDFIKGAIPALIALSFYGRTEALIVGAFAVIGHCYSIWLGFKGGKGIATSVGIIVALFTNVFPILFVIQFGLIFSTRYMSLASITSAVVFPISVYLFGYDTHSLWFAIGLGAFVVIKHRSNISRLLSGTENKLTLKK